MSANRPATPQPREIEIMKVLFDRRLKDRAIALADSRFPGSGKMVDLAYEWGELSPATRRERLSNIGPDEIARLREFTQLNPDLARAVDELDRRGVLPPIEAAAIDVAEASRETRQNETPEAQSAEEAATAEAEPIAEAPADVASEPVAQAEPVEAEPVEATTTGEAAASPADQVVDEVEYDFEDADISPMTVDMPNLDLGLPTTQEVLDEETHRREEAARKADEAMDRVRKTLEASTQRAFERSSAFGMPKMPEISRPTLPSVELQNALPAPEESAPSNAVDAPDRLASYLDKQVVAMVGPGDPKPTIDELVALANDRQLGFTEHTIALGNRKEVFGGLVAEFGQINVRAGSIPKAIAGPNLVVIHGRLAPQIANRIEQGFLDIPGTKASVKVHPDARVVVLAN